MSWVEEFFELVMESVESLSVLPKPTEENFFKIADFLSDHIGKKLKIEY